VSSKIVLRGLSLVLVFGAWELAGLKPISLAFPRFSETAVALVGLILDGTLLSAYGSTLQPFAIGIVICGVLGIGCGIAMGLSPRFEWLTLPIIIVLQTAPLAAIIPLITFLYGIGLTAKVFAVVLFAAPVIVLNSYQGIRNTNASLVEMCRSFLGTRRQEIMKVIIPYASGVIFAGLRLGVAAGFIGIVLAEWYTLSSLGTSSGLLQPRCSRRLAHHAS